MPAGKQKSNWIGRSTIMTAGGLNVGVTGTVQLENPPFHRRLPRDEEGVAWGPVRSETQRSGVGLLSPRN